MNLKFFPNMNKTWFTVHVYSSNVGKNEDIIARSPSCCSWWDALCPPTLPSNRSRPVSGPCFSVVSITNRNLALVLILRKVLNFKIETVKLFHKYIIQVFLKKTLVNLLYTCTFSLERLMCSESFFCRFIETALYDFDGQWGSCWCLDRSKQFFM